MSYEKFLLAAMLSVTVSACPDPMLAPPHSTTLQKDDIEIAAMISPGRLFPAKALGKCLKVWTHAIVIVLCLCIQLCYERWTVAGTVVILSDLQSDAAAELKEYERSKQSSSTDTAEWTDGSAPNLNQSSNCNLRRL
ncbi:hypothetical protein JOB18_022318 [Solea senegalensis]|uniref:Uncharacterized protein n=1 Tax=Solea senegalensis TaxID=28829 RepID=A0AAV6QVC8_SOLSE|nr:hypothetical protein JOB18_022318 [Solea senegalensis]